MTNGHSTRTIYKQEQTDKWAFYNNRQLEYYFREGKDLRFEDTQTDCRLIDIQEIHEISPKRFFNENF